MTAVTDRKYSKLTEDQTIVAWSAAAVTPSDSVVVPNKQARGLWIGTGGDVAMKLGEDSTAVTFANVPSGTLLPVLATYVMATNTTATNIVALS